MRASLGHSGSLLKIKSWNCIAQWQNSPPPRPPGRGGGVTTQKLQNLLMLRFPSLQPEGRPGWEGLVNA